MVVGISPASSQFIERKSLCLSSPQPGIASHYGESGFSESITKYFPAPENNVAERLVELKSELKGADTETFWRRLMEGMTEICHAQYGFVAKRILIDDHDVAVEMPPIGEPGSCLLGVAFYYNDGKSPPTEGMHRDYKYLAWGAPCAHMRHDKVFLIPEGLSSFITNNPNAFPFPTEAYLGIPLFAEGKCFAHFGVMWTQEGLEKRDVSWGYLELFLHSLEDLILQRLLSGQSFARQGSPTAPTSHVKPAKVIPTDAITTSQSLKPYARSLSHELRTPMQGVVGMLDVMYATVQEAIEGQQNPNIRNIFQALRDNIEVVQDSSRRAVEAADNVVHAYDLNMEVPDTPQNETDYANARLSSIAAMENRPNILIEGSNIPVNPYKRRRSSPASWHYGPATKVRDIKPSPRRGISPRNGELKSVVPNDEVMLRTSPEPELEDYPLGLDVQRPSMTRRSSTRNSVDSDAFPTPGLRNSNVRELIPLVIHESLRVGGRPDSAVAEPTILGETIDVRLRSSSGQTSQKIIEWSVHPDVPDTLLVDERDLAKLISCVFLNAIKFTEVGTINVTAQPARNNRYILISIADTGSGIPKDFLPELFKPFSREDDSLTRSKEGLGLGLMVAKGLARKIGGDLELLRSETSGPHQGSEFEIKVPLNPIELGSRPDTPLNRTPTPSKGSSYHSGLESARKGTSYHSKTSLGTKATSPLQPSSPGRHNSILPHTAASIDAPVTSSPRRLSSSTSKVPAPKKDTYDRKLSEKYPLTFLVAEDNKINRKLLVNMLGKMGYKDVYEAFDGREAVRIMTEVYQSNSIPETGKNDGRFRRAAKTNLKPVDVILMDLWMPEMDGYEATERIFRLFEEDQKSGTYSAPTVPPTVLAVSADVTDEAISRATTSGMEGFMTKPYKLMDLQRLIEEFCVRNARGPVL